MSRIVSVWLPRWPILRFLAAQARNSASPAPVDPEQPFVLAVDASGGPRIAALNAAAEREGLLAGDQLADARAKAGGRAGARRRSRRRRGRPAAPGAVGDALYAGRLGLGRGERRRRFFPRRHRRRASLRRRGEAAGRSAAPARSASACRRGSPSPIRRARPGRCRTFIASPTVVLPSGQEAEALAPLPIEALRLSPDTRTTLRRLGFKRIGALIDKPRAPFAARFRAELLQRLDQALGRAPEPLAFIAPPPVYHSLRQLLEPIVTQEAIVAVATRLMQDLVAGARARRRRRAQPAACRSIASMARWRRSISASRCRRAAPRMSHASSISSSSASSRRSMPASASRRWASPSPSPNAWSRSRRSLPRLPMAPIRRSAARRSSTASGSGSAPAACGSSSRSQAISPNAPRPPARHARRLRPGPRRDAARPRPLLLLPRAEAGRGHGARAGRPAAAIPLARHDCMPSPARRARSASPANGGAAARPQPTRDYYVVEDDAGHRFWLYREGLYGRETAAPRWFVHGLFA